MIPGPAAGSRDRGREATIWASLFAGPIAWTFNQGAAYAVMKPVCAARAGYVLWLIAAAAFAVVVVGIWLGARSVRSIPAAAADDGGIAADPRPFVAMLAVGLNVVICLLIVTATIPQLLLNPCE